MKEITTLYFLLTSILANSQVEAQDTSKFQVSKGKPVRLERKDIFHSPGILHGIVLEYAFGPGWQRSPEDEDSSNSLTFQNAKENGKKRKSAISLSYGFETPLNKILSLKLGAGFSFQSYGMKYQFQGESPTSYGTLYAKDTIDIDYKVNSFFLLVPVDLVWNLATTDRVRFYLTTGLALNVNAQSDINGYYHSRGERNDYYDGESNYRVDLYDNDIEAVSNNYIQYRIGLEAGFKQYASEWRIGVMFNKSLHGELNTDRYRNISVRVSYMINNRKP